MIVRHLVELVLLSFVLAGLWRAEVELHGWEGLIWIRYPHLAVPVGAALFLAWVAQTRIVRSTGRRWGLFGLAVPYAGVTLLAYAECLRFALGRHFLPSVEAIYAAMGVALCIMATWPLMAFALGRLTRHRLSWALLLPSTLLVWAHWPIGTWWAGDELHAVKTGAAIVPMVIGMGLPWTTRPPRAAPPTEAAEDSSADDRPVRG